MDKDPSFNITLDVITDMITKGLLLPGDTLPQESLLEKMSINKETFHRVLIKLSYDGLIDLNNDEAIVKKYNNSDLFDLFEALMALECLAAELACKRATDNDIAQYMKMNEEMEIAHSNKDKFNHFKSYTLLHSIMVSASQSPKIIEYHTDAIIKLNREIYRTCSEMECWTNSINRHRDILKHYKKRNALKLSTTIKEHYQYVLREMQKMNIRS